MSVTESEKMEDKTAIKITAIVSLTALEGAALYTGLDGVMFGPVVAIIGGIAGYTWAKKTN